MSTNTVEQVEDAYSDAVAYLTAHPERIFEAWVHPDLRRGGILFGYTGIDQTSSLYRPDGKKCGCLTQVRTEFNGYVAYTDALTDAIRADDDIPTDPDDITPAHLERFAAWQRRIDAELGRTPPAREINP